MALLSLRKLTMRFGGLTAVNGFDLEVEPNTIYSIIGPNGAGKTTVFNAVTGIYSPSSGEIVFNDRPLCHPMTWRVPVACVAVGLCMGVASLLLMANVDRLWRVAIKNNNDDEARQLSTAAAEFAKYDLNADGQVSLRELSDGAAVQPRNLLGHGDANDDGQISRTEYLRMMRRPFDWLQARRECHLRPQSCSQLPSRPQMEL